MKFKYKFPFMEDFTAPNGLKIILIPNHMQPVLTASLRINCGGLHEPDGLEGLSETLCSLIQKGSKDKSAEEFSNVFEIKGSVVSGITKEEYTTYSLRCLKKYQNELAEIFKDMIIDPSLKKKEFSIIKKEMITGFKAELSNPSALSASHFNGELFGKEHPAGRIKSLASLKTITLDSLKEFYNKFYSPSNSTLVVSGDAKIEELKSLWGNLFDSWKPVNIEQSMEDKGIEIPKKQCSRIRIIDKPELTQTTLMLGHEMPGELNSDRIFIAVANYILGGGNFSSRLMRRVRTEHGNTYGISSQVWSSRKYGTFSVTTSTRNDTLKSVIDTILNTIDEIVEKGITQEELDKARQYALGSMAFELEGLENVIDKILWLRFTERGNSYIENAQERLEAITVEKVNRVIKKYFRKDRLVIAVTGRSSEITSLFNDLGEVSQHNFRKPVHS